MKDVYDSTGNLIKGVFALTKINSIYPLEGRRLFAQEKATLELRGILENCHLIMFSNLIHTTDKTDRPIKSVNKILKADFLVSKGTSLYFELTITGEPYKCEVTFEFKPI